MGDVLIGKITNQFVFFIRSKQIIIPGRSSKDLSGLVLFCSINWNWLASRLLKYIYFTFRTPQSVKIKSPTENLSPVRVL